MGLGTQSLEQVWDSGPQSRTGCGLASLRISRLSVAWCSLLMLNVKRCIDSIESIDGMGP